MSFSLKYDKEHCNSVIDLSATGNDLDVEVSKALQSFHSAVNAYFSKGISNYNAGYEFNFSFEIVSNSAEDDDPDVEAMMQFTIQEEGPQDLHIHVCGGKASKFVTSELILPAYTYLLSKCAKLGFTAHESPNRRFGAPIRCVPSKGAVEIECPGKDPKYLVTQKESPKLNDEYLPNVPHFSSANYSTSKTSVFG